MLIAVVAGLAVGFLIGGLGGGGAILTVPVLVYALHESPHEATTSSLVIVGLSSLVGLWSHHRVGNVQWGQGALFGVVGIGGTYGGALASQGFDGDTLLFAFAVLLVVVAVLMLLKAGSSREDPACEQRPLRDENGLRTGVLLNVALAGTGVGLLTGFFGVGGGFVIVPALTLVLGYCMPYAVATSLLVIVINSATSLLFRSAGGMDIDWSIVMPFAGMSVVGALMGGSLCQRIPKKQLQIGFAVFLLCVASYTAWRVVPHVV